MTEPNRHPTWLMHYQADPEWHRQGEIICNPPGDTPISHLMARMEAIGRRLAIEEECEYGSVVSPNAITALRVPA